MDNSYFINIYVSVIHIHKSKIKDNILRRANSY